MNPIIMNEIIADVKALDDWQDGDKCPFGYRSPGNRLLEKEPSGNGPPDGTGPPGENSPSGGNGLSNGSGPPDGTGPPGGNGPSGGNSFLENDLYMSEKIRTEYGWHNRRFPPELRKACFSRKEYQPDRQEYLYFLMSGWYEKISGCRAPCNFEVYAVWKKKLCAGGKTRYGLDEEEIGRLTVSIEAGTCFRKEKRNLKKVLAALQ